MPTEFDSPRAIELARLVELVKRKAWEYDMTDMFNNDGGSTKRLSASARVLEIIEDKHPDVFEGAAQSRAAIEVHKRSEAIGVMIDIHDGLRRDLNKMKADIPALFDENGTETRPAMWSKEQLDKKAKIIEKIKKGEKAYEKARDHKDFTDVYTWNNSNKSTKPADKSGGNSSGKDGGNPIPDAS